VCLNKIKIKSSFKKKKKRIYNELGRSIKWGANLGSGQRKLGICFITFSAKSISILLRIKIKEFREKIVKEQKREKTK